MECRSLRSLALMTSMAFVLSACGGSDGSGGSVADDDLNPNDPGSVPDAASCAESIDGGLYTAPVTLVNTDSACDYYVSGFIEFRSALTIEAGTVIVVAQGSAINVQDGSLTAVGTASNRIVIRGEQALQGYWSKLNLFRLRPSRLEHVDIVDAGDNAPGNSHTKAGLVIDQSTISLVDVSVSNSYVNGTNIGALNFLTAFEGNRFFGNALAGLVIDTAVIPQLDEETDYLGMQSPNGYPVVDVHVSVGDFGVQTWPSLNAPYALGYFSLASGDKLTLMPGTRLAMEENATLDLINGAVLEAHGTGEEPILFEAAPGATGRWDTVRLGGGKMDLEHVQIHGAGDGITVDGSSELKMSDIRINDYSGYGVNCVPDWGGDLITSDGFQLGSGIDIDDSGEAAYSGQCPR